MSFFFLMCSERSGSNLITKVMNGHEDICGPSTKHVINPVARNFFRYGDLKDEKNWKELIDDIARLMNVSFSYWKKNFDKKILLDLAPIGDLSTLLKNIFIEEAKANQKSHVFVKENQVYEFITFLLYNFPEAKFIYQVRDPRDMALSWKKNSDHKGGVVHAAEQWKKDQMQFLKNHSVLCTSNKSYMIKYEDLTTDFDNKIKEICCFLGVPYSNAMREFYKDDMTIINSQSVPAWENLSKDVISNNFKKFEQELTEQEIRIIEYICYPEMQFLEYCCLYGETNLQKLTYEHIEKWKYWELENIPWNPESGVIKNMNAKRVFYQKT